MSGKEREQSVICRDFSDKISRCQKNNGEYIRMFFLNAAFHWFLIIGAHWFGMDRSPSSRGVGSSCWARWKALASYFSFFKFSNFADVDFYKFHVDLSRQIWWNSEISLSGCISISPKIGVQRWMPGPIYRNCCSVYHHNNCFVVKQLCVLNMQPVVNHTHFRNS